MASVLDLRDIDLTQVASVGGKAAHLGELSRIPGVVVPAGFCVTTNAFRRAVTAVPPIADRIDALSHVHPGDQTSLEALAADLRAAIRDVDLPDDLAASITTAVGRLGDAVPLAVRSSATAEDLPTVSFAGQQDSYLHVVGPASVLDHLRRCWASLFTDRAILYRARNGIDHRQAHMGVVVQRMVAAEAAGVLFTADPVSSNRKVVAVEAVVGLGDALVSGRVSPDVYRVRDGEVVAKTVANEARPVLADDELRVLAALGRQIEAHFGCPQDIEWCSTGDGFQIVQSRPITTLFPIPAADDGGTHVYLSVGHQQMMTDAMKPFGLSIWQLTAFRPMHDAGGRLFVDVTEDLASPARRAGLLELFGRSDPLTRDAVATVLDRGDIIPSLPTGQPPDAPAPSMARAPTEADPSVVAELVERAQSSLAALQRDLRTRSGDDLLAFIEADIQELKRLISDPLSHQALMAGMEAAWWLNDQLDAWLGEKNVADALSQSAPGNVTAEMGLALLDVADAIRPHPEVVEFLSGEVDDGFLDELPSLAGGVEARAAITSYLDVYGMRCVGEIDITRPRWSEHPNALVPLILSNIKGFAPGERERRFERGRSNAAAKEHELLARLRSLPDGAAKAAETKRMIGQVRAFAGYREYPKYVIVGRYFAYKAALLREADRLVAARVLGERDDIFFLRFDELRDVVRTHEVDQHLVSSRKEAFRSYQALTPPRVLTSDGEVVTGHYRRDDLPPDALVGLAVSAGRVEGRARVIYDMAEADLEPGDILVTAYTDPSWSPLFVAAAALVTEVGGLMTHGSVIAREYGLPAVVGVEHATTLIRDGQWIRVDGSRGYVEILRADNAPPTSAAAD